MGLTDLFDGFGEVEKLKIIAYSSNEESRSEVGNFEAMYNPNTFSRNYKTIWSSDRPAGSNGADLKFKGLDSDSVSFELLFDGTGVSHVNVPEIDLENDKVGYVQTQIDKLLELSQTINGDV